MILSQFIFILFTNLLSYQQNYQNISHAKFEIYLLICFTQRKMFFRMNRLLGSVSVARLCKFIY